jgi:hypothetical protein
MSTSLIPIPASTQITESTMPTRNTACMAFWYERIAAALSAGGRFLIDAEDWRMDKMIWKGSVSHGGGMMSRARPGAWGDSLPGRFRR